MFVSHYIEGFGETRDFFRFYRPKLSRERLNEMAEMEQLHVTCDNTVS